MQKSENLTCFAFSGTWRHLGISHTSLALLSPKFKIEVQIMEKINTRPREKLNFRTPKECFYEKII